MRQCILSLALLLLFGFDIPFNREWTPFGGWCFQAQKAVKTWVCFPPKWGGTEILAMQEIELTPNHTLFFGYKWTRSKDIPEFIKAKTEFAHGPHINYRFRF